jgi:hypothetical protein
VKTLAVVAVVAAAAAAPARADTTAGTTVAQMMLLEPGDPSFKLFHGAVWLEVDKATVNYRWGGLHCKGRELGDTSVQILFAAFRAGDQVKLEYVTSDYKDKQYRCVTGFTISK